MVDDGVDKGRRRFLTAVTSGVGAVGGVFAATPFVLSMTPSERAKAAGAPVEIDISRLQAGQMLKEIWRGSPVWVVSRTPEMLESLKALDDQLQDPNSERSTQPKFAKNEFRSKNSDILVLVGICTHLGCSPVQKFAVGPASGISDDWPGGFFCPCHGSKFDLSGRVYKNVPAPTNMVVPPYKYVNDTLILIGDTGAEA
jgi:ubiquinol-cytochrome c reductase iron-sulfur subunit